MTGRIRTSGLPGRRTTTWQYGPTLRREFCWFCTFAAKTRKSPLLVVTTGFFGILWCRCTVVVKWWSRNLVTQHAVSPKNGFAEDKGAPFWRALSYSWAIRVASSTNALTSRKALDHIALNRRQV